MASSLPYFFATLFKTHLPPHFPLHHLFLTRCNVVEPLKFNNGKPCLPLLTTDPELPTFLSSNTYYENAINKSDTRLLIFSGAANPALAQEIACYIGLELGKIKIKCFTDGEIYLANEDQLMHIGKNSEAKSTIEVIRRSSGYRA